MKGVNDQNNASLEWMNEKKKDAWTQGLKIRNDWMDGQKNERKEARKEGMNEPKEWDFGNFRKVKFELINLCKIGIEKMFTSYLPLSNAMTERQMDIFALSPHLYFSKNNDKREIIAKQINF